MSGICEEPLSPVPRAQEFLARLNPAVSLRYTPGQGPRPSISAGVLDFTLPQLCAGWLLSHQEFGLWRHTGREESARSIRNVRALQPGDLGPKKLFWLTFGIL
jgi:hypothetical protein